MHIEALSAINVSAQFEPTEPLSALQIIRSAPELRVKAGGVVQAHQPWYETSYSLYSIRPFVCSRL